MNNKGTKYGIILLLLILALTGANLLFGSVNIPAEAVWHILTGNEVEKASWSFIVWESRLPQAITAVSYTHLFAAKPSARNFNELFLKLPMAELPSISVGPEPAIISTTGQMCIRDSTRRAQPSW